MSKNKYLYIKFISGVFICGIGLSLCYYANIGSDPYSVFIDSIHCLLGVSYGVASWTCSGVLFLLLLFMDRTKVTVGMPVCIICMGIATDFGTALWSALIPEPTIALSYLYNVMSLCLTTFGFSLYKATQIGIAPLDGIHIYISEKMKIPYKYVRFINDLIFLIAGALLGGVIGSGTVIFALLFGQFVELFEKFFPICKYAANGK